MNIVVCVKQIPDPANPYSLDEETSYLIRPEEQVLDDTDRYGVEVGLQLAAETEGTVTLVSMGPAGNMQGVRQALAMGADQAILIDDEGLRGSGALDTAKILAAAIARNGFDIVIAGTESTDGYTGVVPQQIAEILEVPALTFAKKVDVADGNVSIHQQTATGYNVVSSPLPAMVSVTAGVVEPRYPTFKGIMAAKSKPGEAVTASDLGVAGGNSGQSTVSVGAAEARSAGQKYEDDGEGHTHIVAKLEELKVI